MSGHLYLKVTHVILLRKRQLCVNIINWGNLEGLPLQKIIKAAILT
jgi:hypothetical protein